MDYLTLLIGICSIGLLLYFLLKEKRPPNFPPGPSGYPLLGTVLEFGDEPHKPAIEYAKIYGDIIGTKFGSYWTVILNNVDDLRAAYQMPEFTRKIGYNEFLGQDCSKSQNGVVKTQGAFWADMRRFSLKTLRDFGFGKKSFNSAMLEEVDQLVEKFRKDLGSPIKTDKVFNASVLNIIWRMIAGQRFSLDDPRLKELLDLLHEFMTNLVAGVNGYYYVFPWLVTLSSKFPFLFPQDSFKFRAKIFKFLHQTIEEHRNSIEPGNPRDFIDSYLDETIKAKNDPNSNFKQDLDDFNLKVLLMEFFIAGSDTTSSTLRWAFFLLALHPEEQEKMAAEIRSVVGDGPVTLDDRSRLPIVESVITETHRVATIGPVGEPHATSQDVTFKGFHIPENTTIYGNIYAVHFDEKTWGDPFVFRPGRFLSRDDDENLICLKHKSVIPFGVGKRACLGASLATDELFIFLTNLIQNFKITMPKDEPKHTLIGQPTGIPVPEPHNIILLDRNN